MRQLKSRIWDKQNRHWITENGYSLHCNSNWAICPFTGTLTDYVSTIDNGVVTYTASPATEYYLTAKGIVSEPRYVVVQCTGLKDSKGKEIYEGDILSFVTTRSSYDGLFSGNTLIGEVKWSDLHCASVFKISSDDRHDGEEFQLFNDSRNKEIIGNIFETPELLKQ